MSDAQPRILIVRLSAIGDVIHVLPSLAALRDTWPDAFIGWLVEDRAADLLRGLPELDRLHVVPRRAWKQSGRSRLGRLGDILTLRRELESTGYDIAIDFQGLTKSGVAAWMSGARVRIGYGDRDARELNRWFTNRRVRPGGEWTHVVDRNGSLLAPLGIGWTGAPRFPLTWTPAEGAVAEQFLEQHGTDAPLAVLNPGAGWETKLWPVEHFAELARLLVARLSMQVAVAWGPGAEETMARRIVEQAGAGVHMAPPTTMRELAALLSHADLFVGSDTGPMHLAVALDVPTVALFGAADYRRNGPYGADGRVPSRKALTLGLDCSPCWKRNGCPYDVRCMRELDPRQVFEAAAAVAAPGREKQRQSTQG